MASSGKPQQNVRRHLAQVPLLLLFVAGCAEPADPVPAAQRANRDDATNNGLNTERSSLHYFLGSADIDKFRPGRPKSDILKDVQWRGNFAMAAAHKGRSLCAIGYQLFSDDPDGEGGEAVFAIFVDDKFVKFVKWFPGEMVDVPYEGTTSRRPKRINVGDIGWLTRAVENDPANVAELEKEVKSRPKAPSQIDPGLTIAYLLIRAALPGSKLVASEEDYKRNAELRDQFNAARLEIGMTPSEIEAVFKAQPIESGELEEGSYRIFGSNESFSINHAIHFANILIVFKEGKAALIYSASPGDNWRGELQWAFIDLPPARKDTSSGK